MTDRIKGIATYDPEADAIGVYFAAEGAEYLETEEVAPGLSLDYDVNGRVIGVEIAGVRRLLAERKLPAHDETGRASTLVAAA